MKICQITHGRVNPDGANGITRTVYNLNKHLNENNVNCEIFSFNDGQTEIEDFYRDEHTTVKLFPRSKFFKNKIFCDYILSDAFDFDLVHFHLMWMVDKNTILKALRKKNIPYTITTHAAFTPDRINSFKKIVSMKTIERDYLEGATALHALCNEEMDYLRKLDLKNPIHIVPNGISSQEIIKIEKSRSLKSPFDSNFINIVWVGRIREDKNVLGIVKSLLFLNKELRNKIKVHIVGNGIENYIKQVEQLVNKLQLESNVIFYGPKFKEEKYQFIVHSDIYIQPSFSEGLSFSILDAMACGKPMILSRQTNMTYYYNKNFYEMTEPFPESIAISIKKLVVDTELRKQLGINSKKMIDTLFNWESLIHEYISMYKKIVNDSDRN